MSIARLICWAILEGSRKNVFQEQKILADQPAVYPKRYLAIPKGSANVGGSYQSKSAKPCNIPSKIPYHSKNGGVETNFARGKACFHGDYVIFSEATFDFLVETGL